MNGIYNLILNNDTFNNIIYNLIDNKSIVIIKKNDNLNYLIEYLNDFILNKFNDITLREIFHDIENNNKCHAVNKQKLTVLKRKITNGLEDIISIFFAFNNKGENGYSLNDLYSITSKSMEFKDDCFEYYPILCKCPSIIENEKFIINDKVELLINNKYVEAFIKYKKFSNNKKFSIIKDNVEMKYINYVINKLSSVLNNKFAFMPPIYINEYTSDFESEEIYYKKYDSDELRDIVRNINYKHNNKIIENIELIRWYDIFNLKRYRNITNNNNKSYTMYKEKENIIYNQYIENIENLQLFSKSFSFLNKVYKEEVLEEINNKIINEEELYNYIYSIKETLTRYKEFLILKGTIESLDKTAFELIDYIYENIEKKGKIRNVLEFIPKYYLYKEIENLENEKIEAIEKYNNIPDKLIKLNKALKMYCEMLIDVAKKVCNESFINSIKNKKIKYDEMDISKLNDERYNPENIEYLLKLFPIVVLSYDNYKIYKDEIEKRFNLIVHQSELENKEVNTCKDNNLLSIDRLDKEILKMLKTIGYNITVNEDDGSIIYIKSNRRDYKDKVIYINNKEIFGYEDFNKILELIDSFREVVFIWYRNWWMNKSDEVQRIQKVLNKR